MLQRRDAPRRRLGRLRADGEARGATVAAAYRGLDEQLQLKETNDATPPSAKKQRLSAGSDGSPGESTASPASSNVLSAALRKRLQEKMPSPK